MDGRRAFLKGTLVIAAGAAVGAPVKTLACGIAYGGIVYTRDNPGKWDKKIGSHAPKITVEGKKVTITTSHPMSEMHYIVRHTLVTLDGKVLGEKTFYPNEEKAVSIHDLPEGAGAGFYATSFCNKHDMWVTRF